MKSKNALLKALALILALAMILTAAGCAGGDANTDSSKDTSTTEESKGGEETKDDEPAAKPAGPDDTTEHYEFDAYYNYAGTVKPWGQDAASKFMNDKFNITLNYSCPDADADAKLNLMISSDDLPDVIVMDRNAYWIKLIELGKLVDVNTLKYEGNTLDQDLLESTQKLLSVNGGLYGIPNWARKEATGGNTTWMVNRDLYKKLGSPDLQTIEDLHQFALKAKGEKTPLGEDIIPFQATRDDNANATTYAFYRSTGAPNTVETYFSQAYNDVRFLYKDENWVKALKTANQWFREGLISEMTFTDDQNQFEAKLTTGRPAILNYDMSQDAANHFNEILEDNDGNRYDVLGWELPDSPIYPPFEAGTYTYGEEAGTVGWNVNCITTKAENPQRIFDLYSWMLTKEGSINMMYGPEGGLWEGLDENGNPILKKPESQLTVEEKDAAGCWFWSQPAHSDNVDQTKFAVNDALPEEDRVWCVSIQAHMITPEDVRNPKSGQRVLTDENTMIANEIDPNSDLGMQRQTITDECKRRQPLMVMADSEEEIDKMVQELIDFAESNNVAEIEKIYTEKRAANIEAQGYTAYQAWYDAHPAE